MKENKQKILVTGAIGDLAEILGLPAPISLPASIARSVAALNEGIWRILRIKACPPITHEGVNLVSANHRMPSRRAREELGFLPRIPYMQGIKEIAQCTHANGL